MRNQSCVLLLLLLLVSFLTAHNKTIKSSGVSDVSATSQIHNEMKNLSESYWSKYMCKNNNSSYMIIYNTLYELKEVRFTDIINKQTPADQLNNIDKTGILSAAAIAHRAYSSDNKWTEWIDYAPYIFVSMKKINGQWQVENQDRYSSPDCSNLPQ